MSVKVTYVNPNDSNDPLPTDGEVVGLCGHPVGNTWGLCLTGELTFPDGCKVRRVGACLECATKWQEQGHPEPANHGIWMAEHNGVLPCTKIAKPHQKVWLN